MLKKKYYYTTPKCVITVLSDPIAGGIVSGGGLFNYGDTTLISTTPNSGYNFVLWDDGYRELNRNIIVTQSKTYTAQYTNASAPFTVTFDLNGHGSGTAPEALILDSTTGYYATKPTDPIDNVYIFNGWFTTAVGGSLWSFANDEVKCNITLYARWVNPVQSIRIRLPEENDTTILGYEYSGNVQLPLGLSVSKNIRAPWSICIISSDVYGDPYMCDGMSLWMTSKTWSKGLTYIIAVYEEGINNYGNLQLKGISLSCVENGALQQMHGSRLYNMPGRNGVYSSVPCKYYEFTIPDSAQYNTFMNFIWEPIT